MIVQPYLYALLLGTLLLLSGCGANGPAVVDVRGVVTYGGKPLTLGAISFTPAAQLDVGLVRPAVGVIQSDGSYRLRAFPDRDGAQPGEYLVSVTSYTGSYLEGNVKHLIPQSYLATATSGLKATIPASAGAVQIDFDLTN